MRRHVRRDDRIERALSTNPNGPTPRGATRRPSSRGPARTRGGTPRQPRAARPARPRSSSTPGGVERRQVELKGAEDGD
eukprot:29750-Pelagococcus_subviridis.AAC.4